MAGEEIIRARLVASYELQQLVGAAIYAGRAPQNRPAPFVIWRRISGSRSHALDGATSLKRGRFQIDCYAKTYDEMKDIARAAAAAIEGANDDALHAEQANEVDLYEDDAPAMWRRIVDFMTMERDDDGG